MLLKKLETRGFKSFAEKLTIEFGRGITAIVGPNGSGKSNITDAIRWVLGEQNMRTLRGARSEDIIFSGTSEGRRPLGMAEVSITLDNSDRQIPLDYSEIEIMRRVFRSGENEYYLNRTACRLKDIQEILFGTGMGKNNLSVIGQNKVDEILGSKPEERRLIFEEAAGIAKYKQRKKESLRKLDDTNQNLVRIEDVTNEIEGQLPSMKQKAENTEKYLHLAEERKTIKERLLFHKIRVSEETAAKVMHEQTAVRQEADDLAAEMAIFDATQLKRKDAANEQESAINETIVQLDQCRTEAEELTRQVSTLLERIGQNNTKMTLLQDEAVRLDNDKRVAQEKLATLRDEEGELAKKRASLRQDYDGCEVEQTFLVQALRGQENVTANLQREVYTLRQNISIAEEKIRHQQESAQTFGEWQERWQASVSETEQSLMHIEEELTRLDGEEAAHQEQWQQIQHETGALKRQLTQVAEHIRTLRAGELEYEKKYHAIHSRYTVLASMQKEYEGFSRAGKEILSRRGEWQKRVFGAVAELIAMDDEVVVAIETALGAALQNIVVDNEDTAKRLITYLKEHRLGRATFLPLTSLAVYPPRTQERDAAREEGAVGLASELVRCDERYNKVVAFLLNRTVIVRTMDDAIRIARKYQFRVRLITLDGDIFNSGGSMTGGSRMRKEAGFLSRSVELDTLRTQEEEIARKRKQREQELQEALTNQQKWQNQERQSAERQAIWQKRANDLHMQQEKAQFTQKRLQELLLERQAECKARYDAQKNIDESGGRLQEDIQAWQTTLATLEEQLKKQMQEREHLEQARDTKMQESIAIQVQLSSLGEREQFVKREQMRLTGEIAKHQVRCHTIEEELTRLNQITAQKLAEKENYIRKQNIKQDELTRLTTEKENRQKERFIILRDLQEAEQTERAYRKRAKELQDMLHRIEMQYAKQQYEHTRNQEALAELGIESFEELLEKVSGHENDLDDIELTAQLRKLERAIQALGPVNPTAVEEYRELEERYSFLTKQQDDLVEAKTYLTDVIAQIDRVMEKNFTEAFHAIDGHFRRIFARIFGGGQARLELTNHGDMLTTGIEIIAQPPGKKQQNMVLLSGGERALTVIALLFAFLEYRPMPFTVVDEIDAPLDEANLERFVTFLKEFAEHTQFIIITHRKVTMRAADVMHGVTNEDAGVSRVISVKMEDVE